MTEQRPFEKNKKAKRVNRRFNVTKQKQGTKRTMQKGEKRIKEKKGKTGERECVDNSLKKRQDNTAAKRRQSPRHKYHEKYIESTSAYKHESIGAKSTS